MDNSTLKVGGSGLNGLNSRLSQKKNNKDIEQEKLSGQVLTEADRISSDPLENEENDVSTLMYDHSIDYKIYRFNGRLYRDETHLGQNFDEVV